VSSTSRARTLLVSAVLLVLVGLVAVFVLRSQGAFAGTAPTRSAPEAAPRAGTTSGAGSTRDAAPARRVASLVTPESPVSARLEGGQVVPILPVSTRRDRTLDVPANVNQAGWWRGGSRIGDPFGSMLVAAHIDSRTQGLGPFADLLDARAGQRVRIASAHLRQDFAVTSRRLVPQGSLARERWLFAPSGAFRLTLVTCAPPYDRARGGYQNLAVVTAVPVDEPVSRSRS
jgi:hypothetical protein